MGFLKATLKELIIYITILFIAAAIIHAGEFFDRLEKALNNTSHFYHALLYALLFYFLILIVRFIIKLIFIFKNRNSA